MKKTQGAGRDRAWERSCGPAGGCGHEYSDSSNTSNQLSIINFTSSCRAKKFILIMCSNIQAMCFTISI